MGRHLHLWKVEAQATISLRLGLHWAAGLTPILEMVVPSAMRVLGEQRWLVVNVLDISAQLDLHNVLAHIHVYQHNVLAHAHTSALHIRSIY